MALAAICPDDSSAEDSEPGRADAEKQLAGFGYGYGREDHEIKVTRRLFETRLRGQVFDTWEDFLDTAAEDPGFWAEQQREQQGGSLIKLDPMQVFAWVATLMIEIAIWGLVAWSAVKDLYLGLGVSAMYGVLLYVAASRQFSKNLAGMIWPNVPCAVAATGALFCLLVQPESADMSIRQATGWMFFLSILPQTLTAAFWMRALPEDPDRASLVSNVFLGVWAAVQAAYVMGRPDTTDWGKAWDDWYYFFWGSLFLLGAATIVLAWHLHGGAHREIASDELISWTLNVGALGLFVASGFILRIPVTGHLANWLLYFMVAVALGFVARHFGRSFPWLLSALGLAVVSVRSCAEVAQLEDSALLGFLAFGALGIIVAAAAQCICGHNKSGAEDLHRHRRGSQARWGP